MGYAEDTLNHNLPEQVSLGKKNASQDHLQKIITFSDTSSACAIIIARGNEHVEKVCDIFRGRPQ